MTSFTFSQHLVSCSLLITSRDKEKRYFVLSTFQFRFALNLVPRGGYRPSIHHGHPAGLVWGKTRWGTGSHQHPQRGELSLTQAPVSRQARNTLQRLPLLLNVGYHKDF